MYDSGKVAGDQKYPFPPRHLLSGRQEERGCGGTGWEKREACSLQAQALRSLCGTLSSPAQPPGGPGFQIMDVQAGNSLFLRQHFHPKCFT